MNNLKTKFEDLNISPDILKAVQDMGFEEATPIQSQSIDVIKSGRDVIGQSQTGTGKTAAFGIPTLEKIDPDSRHLQALILCPTRELAIQVSEELRRLLKYKDGLRVLPIYGGQPIDRQILALKKGVQIVIGTPGRVMDHMRRRTLKMERVKIVVLDEADEMLDMGFREDIEHILQHIQTEHQTILYSATMPKEILELTALYLKDPVTVKVMPRELTVPGTDQAYFEVREHNKMEALTRIIDMYSPQLSMVFCNTKKRVDSLVEGLQSRGYFAEGLHGDLKQTQRDAVMKKFRNHTLEILVATDVAARGIDVDDIDIVINYDLPQDEEQYIHRIGRTGRAGKTGSAYTFVVGREVYKLRDIMRYTKAKIERLKLPTISDVEEAKSKNFLEEVKRTIQTERLTKYINMVESIIDEDYDTLDIAAALLKLNLGEESDSYEDINERPYYEKPYKAPSNNRYNYDKKSDRRNGRNVERLFINAGKTHNIRPQDIVGAIANEAGISGRLIGHIDIYQEFSFADVPAEYADDIIFKMKNAKFKGIKLNIEKAKGRRH